MGEEGGNEEEEGEFGPELMKRWAAELDDLNAALYAPPLEPGEVDPSTGRRVKANPDGLGGAAGGHFPLTRLAERQAAEKRAAQAIRDAEQGGLLSPL